MPISPTKTYTLTLATANSGIGFCLAALLAEETSNHIILCSRSLSKGETALKDLNSKKLPGTAELLQLDVGDENSIAAAVQEVDKKHGR